MMHSQAVADKRQVNLIARFWFFVNFVRNTPPTVRPTPNCSKTNKNNYSRKSIHVLVIAKKKLVFKVPSPNSILSVMKPIRYYSEPNKRKVFLKSVSPWPSDRSSSIKIYIYLSNRKTSPFWKKVKICRVVRHRTTCPSV